MIDFWVQFAVSTLKLLLVQLHVDVSAQTTYGKILLDIANSIYILYGLVPPTAPLPVPVPPTPTPQVPTMS